MLGEILGNYRVLRKLGEGGMGEVYLAEHTVIKRKAAVKVLLPQFLQHHDMVERFFNEARVTSEIHHPDIVQVYDCGRHPGGSAYLVMEYLRGEPLNQRLKRRRKLPVDEALRIAHHCTSALAAAHAAGVIHRDLKPGNIFLVPDPQVEGGERAKVLDFGIAKLTGDGVLNLVKTRTGSMMGTPVYMSPEQCRGAGDFDHRSDIYALGCVLFRMVCGRPPFLGKGPGDIIANHLRELPPLPRKLEPSIPPELETVILKTLAKSPDDRFASMAELGEQLKSLGRLHAAAAVEVFEDTYEEESVPLELRKPGIETPGAHEPGLGSSDMESPMELPMEPMNAMDGAPETPGEASWDSANSATRRLRPADKKSESPAGETTAVPQRPCRGKIAALVLAAMLLCAAAAWLIAALGSEPEPRGAPQPFSGLSHLTGGASAVATVPAGSSLTHPPPASLPPGEVPGTAAEPDRPPVEPIRVVIESRPAGAEVFQDSSRLGTTPYQYTALSRPDPVILTVRHRGYRTTSVSFPGDRDGTIRVELVARRLPRTGRSAAAGKDTDPKSRPITREEPMPLDEELLSR